jgi:hypothetical protein
LGNCATKLLTVRLANDGLLTSATRAAEATQSNPQRGTIRRIPWRVKRVE